MEPQTLRLSDNDDAYGSLIIALDEIEIETAPISDHHYAVALSLQEPLMLSLAPPKTTEPPDVPSMQEANNMSSSTPPKPTTNPPGESSRPLCEICASFKDNEEFFPLPNCTHKFCTECISRHISIEIRSEKRVFPLPCPGPGCDAVLEMDTCRRVLSDDVVTIMDDAICESMIEQWQRFYCPYKECSALLVKEEEGMREAECLVCRQLLCARCNVPWHAGMECGEYERLGEGERGKDDLMLHDLAKKNGWQRCGVCRFYVERNEGCPHMKCRCGHDFCDGCGKNWSADHDCENIENFH